jgi:hypothetical protein
MKNKPLHGVIDGVMGMIHVFDFSKPIKKDKKNIWLKKTTIKTDYDINALKKL